MDEQASKEDPAQPSIASVLPPADAGALADVAVVGAGPAGLALAAELGALGLAVVLVARDAPFVNNYGVWRDEFRDLGLEDTLDAGEGGRLDGWVWGYGCMDACASVWAHWWT